MQEALQQEHKSGGGEEDIHVVNAFDENISIELSPQAATVQVLIVVPSNKTPVVPPCILAFFDRRNPKGVPNFIEKLGVEHHEIPVFVTTFRKPERTTSP
jgi:hypothetical protein